MPLLPINFDKWVEENQHQLQPPVNNWCVHEGDDFIVMAVGGPNERSDYHINETEIKGDMMLRLVDDKNGLLSFKDQVIREGEMFLLPANVPHNPVRYADTVGIVIERRRMREHIDRLCWYCKDCRKRFYEETFYCADIQTQLKEIIDRYASTASLRTCKFCNHLNPPQ